MPSLVRMNYPVGSIKGSYIPFPGWGGTGSIFACIRNNKSWQRNVKGY
jgi:hypothetical protein